MKKSLLLFAMILMVAVNETVGQDWPKFRNTLDQTGYTAAPGPLNDDVLWEYWDNMSSILSSPAVLNGKVYFGSMDSSVYCLNSLDGHLIWKYKTGGQIYYSSPAVSNGKVYIGSWDGVLYCIDAEQGSLVWNFNTGMTSGFNSCPTVVDGKVYFGSNNSRVYCLNADTGAEIWSYLTGMSVWSTPAVVDGRVYVGSFDSKLYCLDALTGDSIWATNAPMMLYSSPAISDGKIYFGSVVGANAYCLNLSDGSIVWSKSLNGAIFSSPAVRNGKVFFGVDQVALERGLLVCLDANTGDSFWANVCPNFGAVYASPVVNDSLVFYGSMNWHVYCARQSTGEIVWDYTNFEQVLTSPAMVEDRLYFGCKDGRFVCLSGSVGTEKIIRDDFNVYPNPSNGDLKINLALDNSCTVNIVLYNASGKEVSSLSKRLDAGKHVMELLNKETNKLSPGIYFCTIRTDQSTTTSKIVVL